MTVFRYTILLCVPTSAQWMLQQLSFGLQDESKNAYSEHTPSGASVRSVEQGEKPQPLAALDTLAHRLAIAASRLTRTIPTNRWLLPDGRRLVTQVDVRIQIHCEPDVAMTRQGLSRFRRYLGLAEIGNERVPFGTEVGKPACGVLVHQAVALLATAQFLLVPESVTLCGRIP